MSENDFYIAIQGVLQNALDAGWTVGKIEETAIDAVDEWIGETLPPNDDEDDLT